MDPLYEEHVRTMQPGYPGTKYRSVAAHVEDVRFDEDMTEALGCLLKLREELPARIDVAVKNALQKTQQEYQQDIENLLKHLPPTKGVQVIQLARGCP